MTVSILSNGSQQLIFGSRDMQTYQTHSPPPLSPHSPSPILVLTIRYIVQSSGSNYSDFLAILIYSYHHNRSILTSLFSSYPFLLKVLVQYWSYPFLLKVLVQYWSYPLLLKVLVQYWSYPFLLKVLVQYCRYPYTNLGSIICSIQLSYPSLLKVPVKLLARVLFKYTFSGFYTGAMRPSLQFFYDIQLYHSYSRFYFNTDTLHPYSGNNSDPSLLKRI